MERTGRREGRHQGGGAGGLARQGNAAVWGQFSQEKGQLRGHPAAALAPPGGDGGDAAGLCPVVPGGRAEGRAWAET